MKFEIKDIPDTLTSEELTDYTNEQMTLLAKIQEDEKLKKEEEIKKMQAGEPFDERIVGPVEMEEGTPQDRRCVMILKKEGELYAYTFNALDYVVTNIWEFIRSIAHAIWDLIKKINWCIVCSALRIGYFIGYLGLIIGNVISLTIYKNSIIPQFNTTSGFIGNIAWTVAILAVLAIPLLLQLLWAFDSPTSRWAKVIQKRAGEIRK